MTPIKQETNRCNGKYRTQQYGDPRKTNDLSYNKNREGIQTYQS